MIVQGGGRGGGRGGGGRRKGGGMNQIDDGFRPERGEDGGGARGGRGGSGSSRGGAGGGGRGSKDKMAFTRPVPKFLQQYSSLLERPKWHTEEGMPCFALEILLRKFMCCVSCGRYRDNGAS